MVTAAVKTRAGENYLLVNEEKKLFAFLKNRKDRQAERDYVLLRLCRATGLRRIEALRLNVADLREDGRTIKDKIIINERIAAKGALGDVYLPEDLREELRRFFSLKSRWGEDCTDDAPLFVSKKGNRLSKRQFNELMDKWCPLAGIPRYTPHALRHTKGQRIMSDLKHLTEEEQQKKLNLANRQLRHKSLNSTLVYTAPTKAEMEVVGRI